MASSAPVFLFIFLVVLLASLGILHSKEENCSFDCGKLGNLRFPFLDKSQDQCGGLFPIEGCNETIQKVQLTQGKWYEVENITQPKFQPIIITIQGKVLLQSEDCKFFSNLNVSVIPVFSYRVISNITILNCTSTPNTTIPKYLDHTSCDNRDFYYMIDDAAPLFLQPPFCSISLYTLQNPPITNYSPLKSLTAKLTFEMDWAGKNWSERKEDSGRPKQEKNNRGVKLGVGILFTGVVLVGLIICFTRKFSRGNGTFPASKEANSKNIEGYNLAAERYSYKDIKKITNKFRDKLGEGGFGSVYKGLLPDGRQVAVKVLKEAKDHDESFFNEVASISRTSHVNVVSLLGFCFEGHKQALIYEFMVNGSLEKFIHPLSSADDHLHLRWEMLYQIAVGIARGLEYLHRGCNTRILHFDIKPHNILLDDEFCPKISDFGLSKLCHGKESAIFMTTGARGTAGYIAPEVFSRNFGVVSHKSDVYSYGMMVLEMVGGRKNINVEADHTSEIYFPHWIYSRLELDDQEQQLGLLQSVANEDDKEISRKMIIVGLWCIQTNPSNRPPMSHVLKMLQGNLESLEIPPKPYLSSPPRLLPDTQADSSSTFFRPS